MLVGRPWSDVLGDSAGSAFVLDTRTGRRLFELTASDGAPCDTFGRAVAMNGDLGVIGAYANDDAGSASGSAYLFDLVTGAELCKLTASDADGGDWFGCSVSISGDRAIDGDRAVVGAKGDDENGPGAGSAYVFDVTSGLEVFKLTASDGMHDDAFGESAAIDGDRTLVGAPLADPTGAISGSTYLFSIAQPIGTSYCDPAAPNSSGLPAEIFAVGSEVVSDADVVLAAVQMPAHRIGIFLGGPVQGFTPNAGGSQGNLCLRGPVGRHAAEPFETGTAGKASLLVDLSDVPTPGGGHSVLPGETWNWTAWFVDANPGHTSNFTDAVSISFQ